MVKNGLSKVTNIKEVQNGPEGQMEERDNTCRVQQILREWSPEPWGSSLSFTLKWHGFSYCPTKLEHSPEELNHYIIANIRNL